MKNKTITMFALGIIGLLAVAGIAVAFPFEGIRGNMADLSEAERTQMQEQDTAMRETIENKDFAAWKSLMNEQIAKMQASLTEENFNSLVQMHKERETFREAMQEARESGDYSAVEALQEEYGIPMHMKQGMRHQQFKEQFE